jgi:hypothetical protein
MKSRTGTRVATAPGATSRTARAMLVVACFGLAATDAPAAEAQLDDTDSAAAAVTTARVLPAALAPIVIDTSHFIHALLSATKAGKSDNPGVSSRLSFRTQENKVFQVREYGEFAFNAQLVPGDEISFLLTGAKVDYFLNDTKVYSSVASTLSPLYFNSALLNASAAIRDNYFFTYQYSSKPCGLTDSDSRTPVAYNTFLPPGRGETYRDPVFGCKVVRLTDGLEDHDNAVHHEYSSVNPFNADSTRILVLLGSGSFYIIDNKGSEIVSAATLGILGHEEPRWSISEPDILYYHFRNQLRKYDISTGETWLLRTFHNYSTINFGGGEGDISEDGDHIVVVGDQRHVQVYRFSTNTHSAVLDTLSNGYDWFDMTPDNNVLGLWYAAGPGRYRGLELFDADMKFIRQVIAWGGHADRGRDINGDEIIAIVASNDLDPAAGCERNGVVKIRLADSRKTCLLPLYWGDSTHVSINNFHGHPWMLVSSTKYFDNLAAPSEKLPVDWQSKWGSHVNEIILVNLDGSSIRRLAHHRSRALDSYYHMPRAAISGDGRYALFDSNFDFSPTPNYTDVYLIPIRQPETED